MRLWSDVTTVYNMGEQQLLKGFTWYHYCQCVTCVLVSTSLGSAHHFILQISVKTNIKPCMFMEEGANGHDSNQ